MEKRYPVSESHVVEAIYRDSNNKQSPVDSDQAQCTQSMWQKFVESVPLSYANLLALMLMKGREQTVLRVTTQLQHYEDHLDPHLGCRGCPRLWTDLKKSVRKCPTPCQYGPVSATGSKQPPAQERRYTRQSNLCFSCEQKREHEEVG